MPLKSNLLAIANAIPAAIDQGTGETAGQVKQVRDSLVHIDSGELLASGTVVHVAVGEWEVREGDGLPDARAAWEEWGTDKHPPHQHMVPAAEQNRANLAKNVAAQLKALEGRSGV